MTDEPPDGNGSEPLSERDTNGDSEGMDPQVDSEASEASDVPAPEISVPSGEKTATPPETDVSGSSFESSPRHTPPSWVEKWTFIVAILALTVAGAAMTQSFVANGRAEEANNLSEDAIVEARAANQEARDANRKADEANDLAKKANFIALQAEDNANRRAASAQWYVRINGSLAECADLVGSSVYGTAAPLLDEADFANESGSLDGTYRTNLRDQFAEILPDCAPLFIAIDIPDQVWAVAVGIDGDLGSALFEVGRAEGTQYEGRTLVYLQTGRWVTIVDGFASEASANDEHRSLQDVFPFANPPSTIELVSFCGIQTPGMDHIECER